MLGPLETTPQIQLANSGNSVSEGLSRIWNQLCTVPQAPQQPQHRKCYNSNTSNSRHGFHGLAIHPCPPGVCGSVKLSKKVRCTRDYTLYISLPIFEATAQVWKQTQLAAMSCLFGAPVFICSIETNYCRQLYRPAVTQHIYHTVYCFELRATERQ